MTIFLKNMNWIDLKNFVFVNLTLMHSSKFNGHPMHSSQEITKMVVADSDHLLKKYEVC